MRVICEASEGILATLQCQAMGFVSQMLFTAGIFTIIGLAFLVVILFDNKRK